MSFIYFLLSVCFCVASFLLKKNPTIKKKYLSSKQKIKKKDSYFLRLRKEKKRKTNMEPTETKRNPDFKFLIYGAHGWIGSQLVQWLGGESVVCGVARIENRTDVCEELDRVQPTHVLMAAGITGRPTVDWCESHKLETIRTNVIGTLNVIDCCAMRQIHITNFATGCIFEYDEAHPIGGPGFKETDTPNFHGSFYSHSKVFFFWRVVRFFWEGETKHIGVG